MENDNIVYIAPQDNLLLNLKKKALFYKILTIIFSVITTIFLFTTILRSSPPQIIYGRWDSIPLESQIEVTLNISVNGSIEINSAADINGSLNINHSSYYPVLNFYDQSEKISKTLQILPKFKTYQQSTMVTCGPASAFMALRYFGINNISEHDLAKSAHSSDTGTETIPLGKAVQELAGNQVEVSWKEGNNDISFEEFTKMVTDCTNPKTNCVLLLENIQWGGHWTTLIGYDNMGTNTTADDVLVLADPFDTSDHYQDGYYVVSFEKFYKMWIDSFYLDKEHNKKQYVKICKK